MLTRPIHLFLSALLITACSSGGGASLSPDSAVKPAAGSTATTSSLGGAVAMAGTGGTATSLSSGAAGTGSIAESNGVFERLRTLPAHICATSRVFT
jgi:hypothetical protein